MSRRDVPLSDHSNLTPAGVAQLAEAPPSNGGQCEFDSRSRHYPPSVSDRTPTSYVGRPGSIPGAGACHASVTDSTRSFYLRGPSSTLGRGAMNEKEKVYSELHALRKRVFELRKHNRALQKAVSEPEIKQLRAEHTRMRRALSQIAYSPDDKMDDLEAVRVVAAAALVPTTSQGKAAQQQFARAKRRLIAQSKRLGTSAVPDEERS